MNSRRNWLRLINSSGSLILCPLALPDEPLANAPRVRDLQHVIDVVRQHERRRRLHAPRLLVRHGSVSPSFLARSRSAAKKRRGIAASHGNGGAAGGGVYPMYISLRMAVEFAGHGDRLRVYTFGGAAGGVKPSCVTPVTEYVWPR